MPQATADEILTNPTLLISGTVIRFDEAKWTFDMDIHVWTSFGASSDPDRNKSKYALPIQAFIPALPKYKDKFRPRVNAGMLITCSGPLTGLIPPSRTLPKMKIAPTAMAASTAEVKGGEIHAIDIVRFKMEAHNVIYLSGISNLSDTNLSTPNSECHFILLSTGY